MSVERVLYSYQDCSVDKMPHPQSSPVRNVSSPVTCSKSEGILGMRLDISMCVKLKPKVDHYRYRLQGCEQSCVSKFSTDSGSAGLAVCRVCIPPLLCPERWDVTVCTCHCLSAVTWYHLVSPGITWYHLVSPGITWYHLCAASSIGTSLKQYRACSVLEHTSRLWLHVHIVPWNCTLSVDRNIPPFYYCINLPGLSLTFSVRSTLACCHTIRGLGTCPT